MNVTAITKEPLSRYIIFVFLVGLVVLFGARNSDLTTIAYAQQDVMLDRRISQVEQRFYYIESRLNQLESASRYGGTSGLSNRNDPEVGLLRTELERLRADMDLLKTRVADVECAMFKLDERTLSSAARTIRRKTEPDTNEGCRADFSTPIQLSTRR
jgi:hypothetical protein